jgi:serine/threonine protein kinase
VIADQPAAEVPMPPQLHVITGPDAGRTFNLSIGVPLQVGRSLATTTRLTDPSVSRVHCEIEWDGVRAILHNCSQNGTLVNGIAVGERLLHPGDVLRLGKTEIRYAADGPAPARAAGTFERAEQLATLVGQVFHHYALEDVLTQGTTAVCFRASDTRDGTLVALKVLLPQFARDEEEMQRFVRTMHTVLPLRHPNLVSVLQAGKTGPHCWVASEYIDGDVLPEVVRRSGVAGMLDWRHVYRIGLHVARALEYAHGRAVLHRNITPGKILVRKKDKQAVLGDLMLAKALEGALAKQVTRAGHLLGDVTYLAPERTVPGAAVDVRSDLYSLGATLYELLTGRPPFSGASAVEVIAKARAAAPEPPRTFQLSIPGQLEGVVLRLLAKRPEERHASATELLKELDHVGRFINSGA